MTTASAPTKPSSSPMMAKMKSVSDCVQVQVLLVRVAQPHAEAALRRPSAYSEWMSW